MESTHLAPSAPALVRQMLAAVAVLYFAAMLGGAAGQRWPDQQLPRPFRYFTQAACLYPYAARAVIEYRVEAWSCAAERFTELDARPWFAMHADNKESRLHRVGHFYRQERTVMEALEAYLVTAHAAAIASGALDGGRIGGVRLVSVRHPLPPIGTYPVARFATRPLAEIPADHIKRWFWTPTSRRAAWCAGEVP